MKAAQTLAQQLKRAQECAGKRKTPDKRHKDTKSANLRRTLTCAAEALVVLRSPLFGCLSLERLEGLEVRLKRKFQIDSTHTH